MTFYVSYVQHLVKKLEKSTNNKEIYLCLMKAHLKRSWSQSMSEWLDEYGLDLEVGCEVTDKVFMLSKDYINTLETCLRYPYLEAASHHASLIMRFKVFLNRDTICTQFRLLFRNNFRI